MNKRQFKKKKKKEEKEYIIYKIIEKGLNKILKEHEEFLEKFINNFK